MADSCICHFPQTCGGFGAVFCSGCGGDNLCVCAACMGRGEQDCDCEMCGQNLDDYGHDEDVDRD